MTTQRTTYTLLISALLLWTFSALAAPKSGTWTATPREDTLQMNFRVKEHGNMGLSIPRASFQGLNTEDGADTKFQLVREAGTLRFEGRFANGEGAGHYTFEPNAAYLEEMGKLGHTNITPDEHFQLAIFDLGPARVKALAELGYGKMSHDELLQVAIFQLTPEHIRAMKAAGYDKLTMDELVATRIHDVTPKFVAEVKGLGFSNPSLEQLMSMRIHGVTPKFVQEMREAGYPNVTIEQLVDMRIHGIDGNYIRSLSKNKGGGRKE
ncbi:hypothetical protein BO221_26155 [Archangium sp. Cb G35]|uniref:hypothetical protein n=1 Tax=Archangium sp. Cb G35 TaxID=1920190 RepID=UPI0009373BC2|nr:hypothetical protein [Archangium sp. Cb G35]OJT21313.1 hypothetical protein BO221_26155 [Archangium sp. Cb G35]